jgi:glyoxylase-like metal-dependent hydrolase (beta-lactamase superfamily II)
VLKVNRYGGIAQLMMGREMDGSVLYWTAAYLVDGLLIDTGCAYTADELGRFLGEQEVEQVVNTHHHEDHVGANSFIQQQLGLEIYAHPLAIPLLNRRLPLREYQEMVWGYPEPAAAQPLPRQSTRTVITLKLSRRRVTPPTILPFLNRNGAGVLPGISLYQKI